MKTFKVPTRDEVSPANQAIFDTLKKKLGKIPNSMPSWQVQKPD